MEKSEIAKQFELRATKFLFFAAAALCANSVLSLMQSRFKGDVITGVIAAFASILAIFVDVMCIKGFMEINKNCKLSENNQNYYLGRNLIIITFVVIVVGAILSMGATVFKMLVLQYEGNQLTPADEQARANLFTISAILNILLQVSSIATPFIVYLWKTYKSAKNTDKTATVALLTVVVMVVHIVIASLNSVYIAKANPSSFLTVFSEILSVAKYVLLVVYFAIKNSRLKVKKVAKDE